MIWGLLSVLHQIDARRGKICDACQHYASRRAGGTRFCWKGCQPFDETDGLRVTTPDGWWLLRASNTQAVLVGRCEARDPAGLERLKSALVRELAAAGVNVPRF